MGIRTVSLRVPLEELRRDAAAAEGKEMTNAIAAIPRIKVFAFILILRISLV